MRLQVRKSSVIAASYQLVSIEAEKCGLLWNLRIIFINLAVEFIPFRKSAGKCHKPHLNCKKSRAAGNILKNRRRGGGNSVSAGVDRQENIPCP